MHPSLLLLLLLISRVYAYARRAHVEQVCSVSVELVAPCTLSLAAANSAVLLLQDTTLPFHSQFLTLPLTAARRLSSRNPKLPPQNLDLLPLHFRNKLSLPCCNENFQTELCRSVHGVVSFATSMLLETQFLTTRKLYFHALFLSKSSCSPSFYSSSSSALGPKVKFCTAAKGLQTVNSAPSVLPPRHACDPRFSPFPYHLSGLQKQRPFSSLKDEEASHGHGGDWPHQHYEDVRSFRRRGRRHVLCGQLLSCPAARHCLQRNTGFR